MQLWRTLLIPLALVCALEIPGVEVRLNGQILPIMNPDGDSHRPLFDYPEGEGLPLLECLPLTAPMLSVEILTDSQSRVLDEGEAEQFLQGYLVRHKNGDWDAYWSHGVMRNVQTMDVRGEALEPGKLLFWFSWEGADQWQALAHRFSQIHGIEVEALSVPSLSGKMLSTARARRPLPDLALLSSSDIPSLTTASLLQEVGNLEDFTTSALEAFAYRGGEWAIPIYGDAQITVYNPNLLSLPQPGLEGFEEALKILRDNGVPACWNAYSGYWFLPLSLGFGRETIVDEEGEVPMNDAASLQALEWLLERTMANDVLPREREGMMGRFLTGESGLMLTGSYSIPNLEASHVPYALAPFPTPPLLDYKGMSVSRRTRMPAAARAFAAYCSHPGPALWFCESLGKLPATSSGVSLLGEESWVLQDAAVRGQVIPPNTSYSAYKNTLWKLLALVLSNQLSPQEALEAGQSILDEKKQRRISP
ncbi:MAG: extracellular solute-binding protein [Spirochaetales bacterium]|nr:extracellular solute-binding protein [Spirochaetales bacterium]